MDRFLENGPNDFFLICIFVMWEGSLTTPNREISWLLTFVNHRLKSHRVNFCITVIICMLFSMQCYKIRWLIFWNIINDFFWGFSLSKELFFSVRVLKMLHVFGWVIVIMIGILQFFWLLLLWDEWIFMETFITGRVIKGLSLKFRLRNYQIPVTPI